MAHGHPITAVKDENSFNANLRAQLGYCPFCGWDTKNGYPNVCTCQDVIEALPVAYVEALLAEYCAVNDALEARDWHEQAINERPM